MKKLKFIDLKDRSNLHEGRCHGLGYGFCKREGDVLTTVSAISACKDYLNDVVWAEHTGKSGNFYRMAVQPEGAFKTGKAYLAMKVLRHIRSPESDYAGMDKDVKALVDRHNTDMQAIMNWFETEAKVGEFTVVTETETAGVYVAELPLYWVSSMPMISLASWLIRQAHRGFNPEPDPFRSLITAANKSPDGDAYYAEAIIAKMRKLIAGHKIVLDLSKFEQPHNYGICGHTIP